MSRRQRSIAIVCFALSACGGAGASAPMPPQVRITLTDVLVGPVKSNGTPWDGPGSGISPAQAEGLAAALGASAPWGAVASFMMQPAIQGLEAPEVKGTASLETHGQEPRRIVFKGQRDSTHPQLAPVPAWESVPLNDDTRIEVVLTDEDLMNDDPIGTFILNADAIREAVRRREVYQVNVAAQTVNTVLFVGIEANGD